YGTPAARKNGTRRALAAGPYCATRSAIVGSCTTGGGAGRGRRTGALQPAIATIATSAIRRRRAVGETTLIRHAPHRVRRRAVPAPSTSPPSFVLRVPPRSIPRFLQSHGPRRSVLSTRIGCAPPVIRVGGAAALAARGQPSGPVDIGPKAWNNSGSGGGSRAWQRARAGRAREPRRRSRPLPVPSAGERVRPPPGHQLSGG